MAKIDMEKQDCYNEKIVDGDFKVSKYGYRHQQCLIMVICLTTAYSMRACIGVALVGMMESNEDDIKLHHTTFINTTNLSNDTVNMNGRVEFSIAESLYFNGSEYENESSGGIMSAILLTPPYPKFKWNEKIQGVVMSSFFWGYMLLQIPAGQLVHKFGPRYLLVGALAVNSVVSICFPWAACYGGWIFAMLCRMVQGLSQACIMPGMYAFFGKWAPLEERSRLVGFAQGGQPLGIVLGLPITGFIASSSLGWPGIFRFYGILSGMVAAFVFFMVYDTPSLHPKLTLAEKRHIEGGLGLKEGEKKEKSPVPWRDMLRCRALYILALSHVSQTWVMITLFSEIPAFMNKVMQVDIKSMLTWHTKSAVLTKSAVKTGFCKIEFSTDLESLQRALHDNLIRISIAIREVVFSVSKTANGLLTALPFAVMWFTNFFFSWFTDWIIVKKYLSVTNARKMANSLGCVPAAIGFVVLAYAPKNIVIVESILVFICAFKVSALSGSMVTHVDIAPNFAGTMMSITNFCSNLIGSQAPLAVAYLVSDESSEEQWKNVFFLAAGLFFVANLIYCLFGSAEEAPWNNPAGDGDPEEPEIKLMLEDKNIKNKL